MEDTKTYSSSFSEQVLPIRSRAVPDVPEDVDFVMEHLNDPNFDLKKAVSSDIELGDKKTSKYAYSEYDTDSHFDHTTSRAESRNSTAIEFDE